MTPTEIALLKTLLPVRPSAQFGISDRQVEHLVAFVDTLVAARVEEENKDCEKVARDLYERLPGACAKFAAQEIAARRRASSKGVPTESAPQGILR